MWQTGGGHVPLPDKECKDIHAPDDGLGHRVAGPELPLLDDVPLVGEGGRPLAVGGAHLTQQRKQAIVVKLEE